MGRPPLLKVRFEQKLESWVRYPRNCQNVFSSGCTILHSYRACMKVLISPHSQHLLSEFFILANLEGVTWYLTVVWIYISLIVVFSYSFEGQKFLSLMKSNLSVFSFTDHAFCALRNLCLIHGHKSFILRFFFSSVKVLGFNLGLWFGVNIF